MDTRKATRYGALTGLVAAAALVGGMTAGTATAASPAATTHAHLHGVVPMVGKAHPSATTIGSKTLQFGGGVDGIGVTTGHEKVYVVFWGTQWGTSSTDSNG